MSGEPKRRNVNLGETSALVLSGETDYSGWTDEELASLRRKSRRGTWEGRTPVAVPAELVREIRRRQDSRGAKALTSRIADACEYIARVAAGEEEGSETRLKHAVVLLNRVWGMAPNKVELEVNQVTPSPYEKAGVTRAIVIRSNIAPAIDVESEEVELDPFALDEPDPFLSDEERERLSPHQTELPGQESMNPVKEGKIKRVDNVWE